MKYLIGLLLRPWVWMTDNSPDSLVLLVPSFLISTIYLLMVLPLIGIHLLKEKIYPSQETRYRRKLEKMKLFAARARRPHDAEWFRECFYHLNLGDRPHKMGFTMEYEEWNSLRLKQYAPQATDIARAVQALHDNPVLRK